MKDIGNWFKGRTTSFLLIVILSFVILSYLHSVTKMVLVEKNFCDFTGYYFYSQLLDKGKDIYLLTRDVNLVEEHRKLIEDANLSLHPCFGAAYSPLFFYLISFITRFDVITANIIWLLLNHLLIASIIVLWLLIHKGRDFYLLSSALIIMFANQPLIENMGIGQVNIIFLFLFLMVLYLYNKNTHYPCGPALAFVLLLKPQWGLILMLFIWQRAYSVVISTIVSYILFRCIGIVVYGFDIEISYWKTLLYLSQIQAVDVMDHSLNGVIARIFYGLSPEHMKIAFLLHIFISLVLIGITFSKITRAKNDFEGLLLAFSVVITLVLIVSPKTTDTHLVTLFIPFAVTFNRLEVYKIRKIIMLVISFCLISVRYSFDRFSFLHTGIPAILTASKLIGVFILWCLLMETMRGLRYEPSILPSPK